VAAIDRLAELVDDPEVRDLLFGLTEPSDDAARERARRAVTELTVEVREADGTSTRVAIRPLGSDEVRMTIGDDMVAELAGFMEQTPDETAAQLAAVIPDLLDASDRRAGKIEPDELHRTLRRALATGVDTAGPFASGPQ
jgi:hypothetical protein